MVDDPSDYPWSSYRGNALNEQNDILSPHFLYEALGRNPRARCRGYRELFRARLGSKMIEDIRDSTNGNYVLGNKKFKEEIESTLKRRVSPGKPGRPKRKLK